MEKRKPVRRDFIKLSAMALGCIVLAPAIGESHQPSKFLSIEPEDKN